MITADTAGATTPHSARAAIPGARATADSDADQGSKLRPTTGTPQAMRRLNERLLWDSLFARGRSSRAELARTSGLSKPTVSDALSSLLEAQLVRTIGVARTGPGGSGVLYEADPDAGTVFGVDIGRSWIRLTHADLLGRMHTRQDVRNTARTAAALVSLVAKNCRRMAQTAGIDWAAVTLVVVGTPGVFDPTSQRVRYAGNLPGWGQQGLAGRLRDALEVPLLLDNDANLAAVGESTYGAGRGHQQFAYLTVGTGLGMGVIIDGRLYRGATGAAGEIGFLPMGWQPDSTDEAAGRAAKLGLAESKLAAAGVKEVGSNSGLDDVSSAQAIFAAARAGDAKATAVVETVAARLAFVVASVASTLDPEVIAIGGGIGQNLDLFEDQVQRRIADFIPMRPVLVQGELADDAVVFGAVAVGLEAARDRVFDSRRPLRA